MLVALQTEEWDSFKEMASDKFVTLLVEVASKMSPRREKAKTEKETQQTRCARFNKENPRQMKQILKVSLQGEGFRPIMGTIQPMHISL